MTAKTPIWLDCDTGHDDAVAILVAAKHVGAELLGISTTYGNADLTNTTYNTRAILKSIGREDVPVYPGASRPFCRSITYAPDIHGTSGLDGTTQLRVPSVPVRTDRSAVDAINAALRAQPPNTVWLVATGPLTNMALLFSIYPDLVAHIKGLSIMGGAFEPNSTESNGVPRIGNWTAWAEFNIYVDPESARAIFDNRELASKILLAPLDLTHQFLATPEVLDRILRKQTSNDEPSVRRLYHEILSFFAQTYADVFGMIKGPPVHDVLAVIIVLEPMLFQDSNASRKCDIEVVTDGLHGSSMAIRNSDSQCGRTILRKDDLSTGHGITIPRELDAKAAWQVIYRCLDLAEHDSGELDV